MIIPMVDSINIRVILRLMQICVVLKVGACGNISGIKHNRTAGLDGTAMVLDSAVVTVYTLLPSQSDILTYITAMVMFSAIVTFPSVASKM